MIVEPADRTVEWSELRDGTYHDVARSAVLDADVGSVAAAIAWPVD